MLLFIIVSPSKFPALRILAPRKLIFVCLLDFETGPYVAHAGFELTM